MSGVNEQKVRAELSDLLEKNANEVRAIWVKDMREAGLLTTVSAAEIEAAAVNIYDTCIDCLKTGSYTSAEKYAENMAKKGVLAAMNVDQIIGGLLILRDVYGRFIFDRYFKSPDEGRQVLQVYEPVARRILNTVALAFVKEREIALESSQNVLGERAAELNKRIQELQERDEIIRKLSTPIVEVGEDILLIPLIGILDTSRAKQFTESILQRIAESGAYVIVLDISGIVTIDTKTASYMLRTIQAVKLMGSEAIVTGIRPDVATTLVTLGVDLSGVTTRGTLREGLEYSYNKIGLKLVRP